MKLVSVISLPISPLTADQRQRQARFNLTFKQIEMEVPYNESWNNGTGYFDGACRDVELAKLVKPGMYAKSQTPMPNNRKLIFLGTYVGVIVLFERYTNGENATYATNFPYGLKVSTLFGETATDVPINANTMEMMLGTSEGLIQTNLNPCHIAYTQLKTADKEVIETVRRRMAEEVFDE